MSFKKLIEERFTCRKYTNSGISQNDMDKIIHSAIFAPSAKNRQPWRFYILSDEQKNYISDKMLNWDNPYNLQTSVKKSGEIIKEVGNIILIYAEKWDENQIDRIKEPEKLLNGEDTDCMVVMHDYYFGRILADILSIGASVEHMILQATELGLGTTWICDVTYIEDTISEYLEIENLQLICGLAIGYCNENRKKTDRKSKEEIIIGGNYFHGKK